ncbi:connectin [Monomorium pharaonis]|uniref:connectin n=1 Tax=Monomorium pharaonis TaxID=307658 RepID=UPI001747A00B|nr:connectin [Monomorium pharaonis]XP_036142371.1 connectin [Monomorium pharaonis]
MHHFLYNSLILKVLLLMVLFATSGLAVSKSRGKKKIAKETKEMNICDIQSQQAPMYCYCNNVSLQNASDVNCWILSKFERNDPLWDYFTSQIHLEKLTFTVRQIGSLDYVPSQLLHQLKNLRVIVFQYGWLHELSERAFSNLNGVAEINLSRNMIVVLRKYAFENMRNLSVINLDDNRISEINRDTFVNLPNLRKLFLNRNNISTIHDKAFKLLGSLQELELSGNQITVVTRDSFHGLRNLRRLDLRSNQITMIGDRSFIEMPELVELELDQNQIIYISEKAFDNMRNLWKLNLSDNQLVTLMPDFLAGAPGIHFLDLRDNLLKTMTFDNIKPIVTNLYGMNSHLYLSENNLICDCKLAWIWGLRNETKNTKLRDALEELTCFLESNNATQKSNSEDLGRNQPLEIPDDYVDDNSRDGHNEDDDAENDYYDESDNENSSNSHSKNTREGKKCCTKHLFELKPEELPCPELSREDLMASEQPSSRHENARVGSSGSSWFSSGSTSVQAGQSVLVASLLLLSILFFT